MNSRQRVLKSIRHEQPDRAPIFATLTPQVADRLADRLGLPREIPLDSMLSTRISHMDLLTRLGNDCVGIAACAPKSFPTRQNEGVLINEWRMKFKPVGFYNEFYEYPLAHAETIQDLDAYSFPDPLADGRFDEAEKTVRKYGVDYAIVGDLECAMFETSWYLVGLQKFLMDLTMGQDYALELLDRVLEIHIAIGKKLIELGADIIWAGDDFGTQNGMMVDPEMWRMIFKPRIKRMFDAFKRTNPEIKLAWHSCGSILPIIPDFIEIGLDILNPIQPMAAGMDDEYLKTTYGRELVFFGGIDVQHLLPHGTPEEIRRTVKRKIEILGKDGGYIAAPAHNIQPDTSDENILAMFEAVKDC